MSEVLKQSALSTPELNIKEGKLLSFLPAILAVGGSIALALLRIQVGKDNFIADESLMMLALAAYLTAAVFYLTNIYAPSDLFQKIGLWAATAGVFFNLSSWCVRWVASYDREFLIHAAQGGTPMPWAFRYVPFANLYDLSLAFAFGAGITTLLIAHRRNFRFLGAISLPLASMILVLARFIGGELINLPPVLDSYWRPIHVGIASLSYGIALVCFAVAVVYLLKDGVKTEAMAIWSAIFCLAVFATVSRYSIFTSGMYSASTFLGSSRMSLPLRADIPYVGWLLVAAGVMLLGVVIAFGVYLSQKNEAARTWGHRLLKLSLVAQAAAIVTLVSQIKSITNVLAYIDTRQYEKFSVWMLKDEMTQQKMPAQMIQERIAQFSQQDLYTMADQWVKQNGSALHLSLNANPVELAALITCFVATLFVIIFSFRTEKLREALPSLEKIDSLMYKTAGVAFAGLALLLMTGAIWANESWGRYWGWDSKETGAFVAWLTYAGFLHTRISRGWTGRASAYFAIVAFLLVIFTYLGVSYLLPGLHSYA